MSIHPICANKNASLISYNIKLVEIQVSLRKTW